VSEGVSGVLHTVSQTLLYKSQMFMERCIWLLASTEVLDLTLDQTRPYPVLRDCLAHVGEGAYWEPRKVAALGRNNIESTHDLTQIGTCSIKCAVFVGVCMYVCLPACVRKREKETDSTCEPISDSWCWRGFPQRCESP
jgi:hypothetical protein